MRIQAAQAFLSTWACAKLALPWGLSKTAFLREGSGMWSNSLDSRILKALHLRTFVRDRALACGSGPPPYSISGGDFDN
jgi:hypothetical protein